MVQRGCARSLPFPLSNHPTIVLRTFVPLVLRDSLAKNPKSRREQRQVSCSFALSFHLPRCVTTTPRRNVPGSLMHLDTRPSPAGPKNASNRMNHACVIRSTGTTLGRGPIPGVMGHLGIHTLEYIRVSLSIHTYLCRVGNLGLISVS